MNDLEIRPTPFGDSAAQPLLAAAHDDLVARYGSGDGNPIDAAGFEPPRGCFLVAWLDGKPVACAGWRKLAWYDGTRPRPAEDVAELKRMYAVPAVRGSGVAAALLATVEDSARSHGMRHMVLETGGLQPEAIRFYTKNGHQPIDNFGYYRNEPDCFSLGRDL